MFLHATCPRPQRNPDQAGMNAHRNGCLDTHVCVRPSTVWSVDNGAMMGEQHLGLILGGPGAAINGDGHILQQTPHVPLAIPPPAMTEHSGQASQDTKPPFDLAAPAATLATCMTELGSSCHRLAKGHRRPQIWKEGPCKQVLTNSWCPPATCPYACSIGVAFDRWHLKKSTFRLQ